MSAIINFLYRNCGRFIVLLFPITCVILFCKMHKIIFEIFFYTTFFFSCVYTYKKNKAVYKFIVRHLKR